MPYGPSEHRPYAASGPRRDGRSRRRGALSGLGLALAVLVGTACSPAFYPGRLPGAPADATFVEVDGVALRYRALGAGTPVVLVHGFGASLDSWRGVQEALARDHRVVAVDLKGFGWSSRPAGDYSPAAEAALVWGALAELGVRDPVALVGHSWGSSVVLAMALAHPERTTRVVLASAYVYDEQVPSFFRWAQRGGLGEVLFGLYYRERMEERIALAYHDDRFVTQAKVDAVLADLAKPGTTAAALAAARGHHFAAMAARYSTVKAPVLLLWGDDDQITPLRFGQRLVRDLPEARLVVLPACGHIPMVEARGLVIRELVGFLADAPARTPAHPATEPAATEPAPVEPLPAADPQADAGAPR